MDHPTLPVVVGLLVVLFAAWLITGGPDKYESNAGKFIKPPAPLNSGEIYDEQLLKDGSILKPIIPERIR